MRVHMHMAMDMDMDMDMCMDMDMDMDMGVCAQLYCVRLSAATHDIHTAGTPSRL